MWFFVVRVARLVYILFVGWFIVPAVFNDAGVVFYIVEGEVLFVLNYLRLFFNLSRWEGIKDPEPLYGVLFFERD